VAAREQRVVARQARHADDADCVHRSGEGGGRAVRVRRAAGHEAVHAGVRRCVAAEADELDAQGGQLQQDVVDGAVGVGADEDARA
jgi:hypothetical protein